MIKKYPPDGGDRLGPRHWIKVVFLLLGTAALTYYGKFYHPKPTAPRVHGLLAWIVPTPTGLSSLIITGNDGIDSNTIENGLRIWINPPKNPRELEDVNHAFYRGNAMVGVGDSLELTTVAALASMVDTGGTLRLIGQQRSPEAQVSKAAPHLQIRTIVPGPQPWNWLGELTPSDMDNTLQFGASTREAILTLAWNGYRARFWGTVAQALADSLVEPLSVGVIAECISEAQEIPHGKDPKVLTLIYCGNPRPALDSSRMAILGANTGAVLVEDRSSGSLSAKKVHLQ